MLDNNKSNDEKILDGQENIESTESIESMVADIYTSLKEKGYDPAKQIAGYILSEDPLYMPDWNNARGVISRIDRDELLELFIEYYLENRFRKQ